MDSFLAWRDPAALQPAPPMARTQPESRHTSELCEAAYERLAPTLEPADAANLLPSPPEVRAVVRVALDASDLADEGELPARLARLPAEEFAPTVPAAVRDTARAMRHMLARRDEAEQQGSGLLLTDEFATRAHDTRARMLKVALHYFEDDAAKAAELKRVGRKKGHLPLRDDLEKLASFYEVHRDVVALDPKYYRADDVAEARRIAAELTVQLRAAQSDELARWDDRLARALAVLVPVYDELRAAGQYLLRAGGAERFAALPGARKRARKDDAPAAPAVAPVDAAPAAAPVDAAPADAAPVDAAPAE